MSRRRYGSPKFYELLGQAAELHSRKSHDYAKKGDPFGNYHFAGRMGQMFKNPDDAGFVARLGEKLYRLSNLDNDGIAPLNESVADTELDILVIVALWMADRRERKSIADCHTLEHPSQIQPQEPASVAVQAILEQFDIHPGRKSG